LFTTFPQPLYLGLQGGDLIITLFQVLVISGTEKARSIPHIIVFTVTIRVSTASCL
jgi:hypothetical protein